MVRRAITLDDLGVTVRAVRGRRAVAIETRNGLLNEALTTDAERAVEALGATATPVLSYLVNAIRVGDRSIPYSFVTATNLPALQPATSNRQSTIANRPSPIDLTDPPIVLTDWAARRLGASTDDTVWLSYSIWAETGRLQNEMARFRVVSIVPLDPDTADRDLVPRYPGIFTEERMSDWAPPFPVDHAQVTAEDEQYWQQFHTTPKPSSRSMWASGCGRRHSAA